MGVSVLLRLYLSSNEVCNTAYALKSQNPKSQVVPEKFLMEKKFMHTQTHTQKLLWKRQLEALGAKNAEQFTQMQSWICHQNNFSYF